MPRSSHNRRWSITTRLTLFYSVSVSFLVVAFVVAANFALHAQIKLEDRNLLSSQARLVRAMLLDSAGPTLKSLNEIKVVADTYSPNDLDFYVKVLDASGKMVAETPHLNPRAPVSALPVPDREDVVFSDWNVSDGEFFRSVSMWVRDATGNRKWLLQVMLDESADIRFGDAIRRKMILSSAVGLLLAAGMGAWIARSALRPLTAITAATSQVTANQLRTQFDTKGWPVELATLADAFEQMLARLEDSFDRLNHFSANLSHELRTPINNLRGETEVALAHSRSAEEFRGVLESSLEEYDRLSRLIDNLLLIARAASSETKIEGDELDVAREVAAVLEYHEAVAAEQDIQLTQRGAGRVRADPVLFRRMLSNLLSNSLRHTPKRGTVEVAAERHPDGSFEIRVTDSGTGIPSEYLSRIYDRFFRVPAVNDASNTMQGFGLGLSIVKSIMTMHQGIISVESELGKGTRVRLIFPARRVG